MKKTLMFWGCPLLLNILRNMLLRSLQKTATINKQQLGNRKFISLNSNYYIRYELIYQNAGKS